jgi:hypothetical protein
VRSMRNWFSNAVRSVATVGSAESFITAYHSPLSQFIGCNHQAAKRCRRPFYGLQLEHPGGGFRALERRAFSAILDECAPPGEAGWEP